MRLLRIMSNTRQIMSENWKIEERDLQTLVVSLHQLRVEWYSLGSVLLVRPSDLDAIELELRGMSVERHLLKMLTLWLNSEAERSWPQIIEALRMIRRNGLAVKIRDKYCRGYVLEDDLLNDGNSNQGIQERENTNRTVLDISEPNVPGNGGENENPPVTVDRPDPTSPDPVPPPCDRGTAALLIVVTSLCIGFAFAGITLMSVGIRGLVEDDDYKCSLGPHDAFNALNLITGFFFFTGILIVILYILLFFYKHISLAKTIIKVVLIGVIASSLILLVGDMIYSFYVASELLPVVEKWERNQTLCQEGIFRSSFGIIVTYFLAISILIVVVAVLISIWVYNRIKIYLSTVTGD